MYDSYDGMDSLAGLQMTGKAVYIDPLSDEYRSVIEARGVQLQQLQQMPAMLHAVRLDITRYELLDGALRSEGYAARQVLCRLSRVNAQKSKNIFYEARMRAISSRKSCSEHR